MLSFQRNLKNSLDRSPNHDKGIGGGFGANFWSGGYQQCVRIFGRAGISNVGQRLCRQQFLDGSLRYLILKVSLGRVHSSRLSAREILKGRIWRAPILPFIRTRAARGYHQEERGRRWWARDLGLAARASRNIKKPTAAGVVRRSES